MKKSVFYLLIIILSSCGAAKPALHKTESTTLVNAKEEQFFQDIQKPADFQYLKITSKINVENGQTIPTLNATFYIDNNQKVWANITAFLGLFGGARALATPAGFQAYEKINRTYVDSDFSYLNQLLGVDFINFHALQQLLIGKTFVPISEDNFTLSTESNGFILTTSQPEKIIVKGKQTAYNIQLKYDAQLNLNNALINQIDSPDTLDISYDNWSSIDGVQLPKSVKIVINSKKKQTIIIENTNFDFSQMETPFSIPANYQKKEIK